MHPVAPTSDVPPVSTNSHAERNPFLDNLLAQSLSERMQDTINALREGGACSLGGADEEIRPVAVGLQNLFEERAIAMKECIDRADFEIHTTRPSTPCCKLPETLAKESALAVFTDEARLSTIDRRGATLSQICTIPHFTLHLTYTKAGHEQRSAQQRAALKDYWAPKVHTTCIESHDKLPAECSGATYRVRFDSGTEIFFGILLSQATEENSSEAILHLGTADQPVIQQWLAQTKRKLDEYGRTLFAK